jgi:hypothetical protein
MFYQLVPASSAELVLCVNQGARSSKFDRRRGEPRLRESNRRFSQATMRIERTSEYQSSLSRVLDLGQRFQADLDPSQKEQWLALEDALLEHTSRLNQAYFQAGAEFGKQSARLRSHAHRALAHCRKVAAERGRDAEIISALAELIVKLAQR